MGLAFDFLSQWYAGIEGGFVTISTKARGGGDMDCYCVAMSELGLADAIVEANPNRDIYFNVCSQTHKPSDGKRGGKGLVAAIPGIVSDFDTPKPNSPKSYPSIDEVMSALSAVPLRHSYLVQTGYGVHAYWKLHEPILVDGDMTLIASHESGLSFPWGDLLRRKLKKINPIYDMDTVQDVARMMRLPGSTHANGRLIEVLEQSDRRYYPDDFSQYFADGPLKGVDPVRATYQPLIDAAADVPIDKIKALIVNCREFKAVWEGRKTYQSGSERDAALARHAVNAGWNDTDIAKMLVHYAVTVNPDRTEKMLRADYIPRTIAFVRSDQHIKSAIAELGGDNLAAADDRVSEVALAGGEEVPQSPGEVKVAKKKIPLTRGENLEKLRTITGLPIQQWLQSGLESPVYTLVLDGGQQIVIGGESCVLNGQARFAERIYSETRIVLPRWTVTEWRNICVGLGNVCEVLEAPELNRRDNAMWAIRQYLEKYKWYEGEGKVDYGIGHSMAVLVDGQVCVCVNSIIRFLAMQFAQKWTNSDLVNSMRQLGFERKQLKYVTSAGSKSSKSYWCISAETFQDLMKQEVAADGFTV